MDEGSMEELIIRDSRGVCPKCSGMITSLMPAVSYRCIDCKAIFIAIGKGYTENAVIVKEKAENG